MEIGMYIFICCFYFWYYSKGFVDIVCFFLKFDSEICYVGEKGVGYDVCYNEIKVSDSF